jgi:hypothetical protein
MIEPSFGEAVPTGLESRGGPAVPRSRAGRIFGVVVLTAFLIVWLTATIGMSRFAAGFASGIFVIVPLMMAVVGTLVIGGSIVRLLGAPAPEAAATGPRPSPEANAAAPTLVGCGYCGVLGPAMRTKCPACGAPNRGS